MRLTIGSNSARRWLRRLIPPVTLCFLWTTCAASALMPGPTKPTRPGTVRPLTEVEMKYIVGASGGSASPPVGTRPGPAYRWEGSVGGVNTATGNKMTTIPIVGWTARGGLPVNLSLYHNSQSTDTGETYGRKWRHSFQISLDPDGGYWRVTWGNGLSYRFTEENIDNTYGSEAGFYDTLEEGEGYFDLTTKYGIRYRFAQQNGNGYLCSTITDLNGNTITLSYDGSNRVETITDPTGREIALAYANDRLSSVTGPLQRTWNFTYTYQNSAYDLTRIELPEVTVTGEQNPTTYDLEFAYDASHNITTFWDARGNDWNYTYYSDSIIKTESDACGNTTTYTYNAQTLTTTITDANNHSVKHTYSSGELVRVTDALDNDELYEYDDDHNVIALTDRRGNVWEYEYDELGNCTFEAQPYPQGDPPDPLETRAIYTYGDYARMTSRTDPRGHYTLWEYDDYGNLTDVYWKASEEGSTLFRVQYAYPYPNYGLPQSKTEYKRGETFVTVYGFDTDGNLTDMTTPNDRHWQWTYNEYGVRTSQIAPNDETVTYTLDEWDRVVEKALDTGGTYTYTFDGNGNLTQMTGNGATWTWVYDENNRKTSETKGNRSITYVYDQTGKKGLLSKVYDWASTGYTYISYSYTARNQIATVSDASDPAYEDGMDGEDELDSPGGGPPGGAAYTYDENGNVTRIVRGNGTKTFFVYDEANRVTGVVHRKSDNTLLASYEYEYTDDDLVAEITEDNGDVQTFTYDEMDRLVAASRTGTLGTYSEEYELDGAGNRLSKTVGNTVYDYSYSDDDELLEEWVGQNLQRSWQYDLNGNQTSRTVGQTTHTFSYNSENRLRLIQQGMSSVEFAYDGLGRRISRTVSSGMSATTTHFFYDGDRVINEQVGSSAISVTYRYGVGLIRRNNEWPLFDSQGNTRLVTNANQAVSASVVYDAFGNVTYSSGSASLKNKYCGDWGYRDDGDAGLLHVGARYYDPTTGRFTTRDTILTEHPYIYCNGDPVNAVDFTGRLPVLVIIVAAGVGAIATVVGVRGCGKDETDVRRYTPSLIGRVARPVVTSRMPGVGRVIGTGSTLIQGEYAFGEGLAVFGGLREAYEDALDDGEMRHLYLKGYIEELGSR